MVGSLRTRNKKYMKNHRLIGTLAIFVGSALAATAAAPPTTPAKLADADAAAAASKEDWTPAAEPEPGDRL